MSMSNLHCGELMLEASDGLHEVGFIVEGLKFSHVMYVS